MKRYRFHGYTLELYGTSFELSDTFRILRCSECEYNVNPKTIFDKYLKLKGMCKVS